jgi:hypothetical protein
VAVSQLGGDHAIWIVAALLYVFDAAKLLSPREFLVVETGRGRFAPALGEAPFTLAGRVVAFGALLRPDRAVFVLRWGDRWAHPDAARAAPRRFTDISARLFPLRLVVIWSSVWLFAAGPALTVWLGLDAAIYCAIAAVYPAVLAAGLVLWHVRAALRLSRARIAKLVVEALVFPPALANLVRKVTLAESIEGDGVQTALALLDPDGRERFWDRLERRAEELINEVGRDDPEGQRLLAYMAAARAAR